jgi:hypothetical protein
MELVVSRASRLARLMWYDGYGFHAGVAQLVEYLPSKQGVAGSSPVSRSKSLEFQPQALCTKWFQAVPLEPSEMRTKFARNGERIRALLFALLFSL